MPMVRHIYHYPIKGLSAQPISKVTLASNKPLPYDRMFALARPRSIVNREAPRWAKKGFFIMLMLFEQLARVKTWLDVDTLVLTVTDGTELLLTTNLADTAAYGEVERFIQRLVPSLSDPPTLVRSPDGHFMDKPDSVISLINLATVRSIEEQLGIEIDLLRFRANIYIEGARPWEEFDWIDHEIRIANTLFHVDRRNGRCGATNVNPASGRRDLDIPGAMRATFSHKDCGVYLVVCKGGEIGVGDEVIVPAIEESPCLSPRIDQASQYGEGKYICRGCYFIYDESRGLPQQDISPGTLFTSLPEKWRCPDCGTEKSAFRPS